MAVPITFETLKTLFPFVAKARKPIMLRGAHGIGKSEIIYQFAQVAGKVLGLENDDMPVVERRASQMPDAGDIMGLPFEKDDVTAFKKMEWFHQGCIMPVVLFFDEVDRANIDVRQSLFELSDSRKIAGHKLHPDTIIVACVNSGEEDHGYQVGEFDPAELDRWTVFDVAPSHADFLSYAKDKIDSMIWNFLKENPAHLEHTAEFAVNKKYPSRRSWFRLNDILKESNVFEDATSSESSSILFYIAQSTVGQEAAIALQDYAKNFERQLTIEDIFVKGKTEQAKKLEINQHISMIDKFGEHDISKEKFPPEVLKNVIRYFMLIPAELAMSFWKVISDNSTENGLLLYNGKVDGVSAANYLARINGAAKKTDSD